MKLAATLLAVTTTVSLPFFHLDVVSAQAKDCPPGLAKKNPPCVPPGQARKGVTTDQWLNRDRIGEVIDRDDLTFLDDYLLYDLPRLPIGQRYAVVEDRIVVIDAETYQLLQLIKVFTALAD